MDLFDRIFEVHKIFRQSRYPVPRTVLQEKLECSRATIKRIITEMKNYLGAPVEYNRQAGGYCYAQGEEYPYELPGLWFNASELQALLTFQHLLSEIQPGILEPQIAPFKKRVAEILKSKYTGSTDVSRRVRILGMGIRRTDQAIFQIIAGAVIKRKCLDIVYHGRIKNITTTRTISPQRLVHYRDNWYLDAWDHKPKALRSFALDRIKKAVPSQQTVKPIPDKKMDDHFAAAYGIFAGKPKYTAKLRFTPECARWVAEETWHPQQKGEFTEGYYQLEIPYADTRELVMDILKYGPQVKVIAPASLQKEVKKSMEKALSQYTGKNEK